MSSRGKLALSTAERVRGAPARSAPGAVPASTDGPVEKTGCGCGCQGGVPEAVSTAPGRAAGRPRPRPNRRPDMTGSTSRAAALARRKAQSARGKAGIGANGMSAAQTARAANPQLSGRELAQVLREQRSRKGSAGQKRAEPSGRRRPARTNTPGAAQDAAWKVGASETAQGQTVTGTMVGRSRAVTGDEPSTCRTVTGTEYMGADIFRDFCQAEPPTRAAKVGVSQTARGSRVTGSEVGRSRKVTGDEPGTCKRVTGAQYAGADQLEALCATRPEAGPSKVGVAQTREGRQVTGSTVGRSGKVTGDEPGAGRQLTGTQYMQPGDGSAPPKVGASATLRGGAVTGTLVGRSGRVTGDEPGTCRNVTGDDYVGQEQYRDFCDAAPAPQDRKVGVSTTLRGEIVTGTMTGRSSRVTGDEPGTCKSVTGTPYAGAEQYRGYCATDDSAGAAARAQRRRGTAGAVMSGLQPGVGGKTSGDARGACEAVTGTPYLGADQIADACPAAAAEPGSPDFPQALAGMPWEGFSVATPAHAVQTAPRSGGVTGTRYDQGQITGPFGMASGKVTGTEEARFGQPRGAAEPVIPATAEMLGGRVKSRITGEGQDAGQKITGDDWERGDRVTGTEGASARRRNPTRRGGPANTAAPQGAGRNEALPEPVSRVTGGSGNTEKGALVTYSGGARG